MQINFADSNLLITFAVVKSNNSYDTQQGI